MAIAIVMGSIAAIGLVCSVLEFLLSLIPAVPNKLPKGNLE